MKSTTNWREFFKPVAAGIVAAAALGSAIGPRAAGQESGAVPPARPPQVPLTLDGHATKGQRAEVYEGRRVLVDEDSFPRTPARLVEGPTVRRDGKLVRIAFALDKADDVLVRIVDAEGRTVRNLACGVLGDNAPEPFTPGSLRQELAWDGTDGDGKPAPDGCRVHVAVGLAPRLDRFVAHDPEQIVEHVVGLEVDPEGRVYVALFTNRRGDAHVVRYDRDGNYLDTVYPPNPNRLREKLSDVYRWVDTVDGREVPMRFGGAWPFIIYKYHGDRTNPTRYPFPLRIGRDGRAFIAETQMAYYHSQLVAEDYQAAGPLEARILPVRLEPFWFLEGMTMGRGPWTLDAKGFAYLCRDGVIVKTTLPPAEFDGTFDYTALPPQEPVRHFEFNGEEKLAEARATLGTPKSPDDKTPRLFEVIQDISVDDAGNLYVVDRRRLKVFGPNGRLVAVPEGFELDGATHSLGDVHGVKAVGDALYVTARLEPAGAGRWSRGQLVKFTIGPEAALRAVWSAPLDPMAGLVTVDERSEPPIVWVANGGGPATFSRVVDLCEKPGEIRHCGSGIRKGVLIDPWAIAVDGQGRLFVHDYGRNAIVRTNDDGSEWLEVPSAGRPGAYTKALRVDRARGRLFACHGRNLVCTDLDLQPDPTFQTVTGNGRYGVNLGAVDAQGNLYVTDIREGAELRGIAPGLHGVVRVLAPDGSDVRTDLCRTFLADGGVARDSKGNIYVTDTAKMGFMDAVHDWEVRRGRKWQRDGKELRCQSHIAYLVKFPPGGGSRGTDAELWAHRGVSPVMGGGCACPVPTACVAIDEADRIFATDYQLYHVKVLDTAGNLIARIGAWGGADCQGPESRYPEPEIAFAWVHSIDTFGDFLYASDRDTRRVLKVRLDYRHTQEASIP